MKKIIKLVLTVLFTGICSYGYSQNDKPDYMKAPKPNEKVIGTVNKSDWKSNSYSDLEVYQLLLNKAKQEFPNIVIDIRDIQFEEHYLIKPGEYSRYDVNATGKVVDLHDPETQSYGNLSKVLDKALRNVRQGSRLAIDQVSVWSGINREDYKDQIIDILLDKGYKVVAKEYIERLYEEQQNQQSGIYNERTTVQENNFSAVGYYINVKGTETSLRVQVVNVSTGEYEGNATVYF